MHACTQATFPRLKHDHPHVPLHGALQDIVFFDGPDYDPDGSVLTNGPRAYDRCMVSATTSKVLHGLRHATALYRFGKTSLLCFVFGQ